MLLLPTALYYRFQTWAERLENLGPGTRKPTSGYLSSNELIVPHLREEATMKASNTALMTCAALALGTANASAGPCNQEIMNVTKKLAATDAGSGPSTGNPGAMAGDQKGQHPGTSVISKETQGKATSPQDVQRQSGVMTEASQALERARALDAQGKETECMNEVSNAKRHAGL
jgi:hypothetical protein